MTSFIAAGVTMAVVFLWFAWAIRCKHQWEFVDKTEFEAPIETAKKNGVDIEWSLNSFQIEQMSRKTVVIVIRCPKCGRAQVLRETH